jgi:hypothetical protein
MAKGTCKHEEGCPEEVHAKGYCKPHYARYFRNGDSAGGRHRYRLDEGFFDVVDTEAKAYWLGFINADGCVQAGPVGTGGWQRHAVSIGLKPSDAGHLEKLKADMGAESPVLVTPQVASIALSSIRLTESLIRLGVTPRKSLTATPWDGPAGLMRHYWRGMFDGDGTIVKHPGRDNKWHLRLLGTEACMEAFKAWAVPVCGSAARIYPKANIFSWTAGGLASPQALARELYAGSTVYLDRKYELALQLMAAPVLHQSQRGQKCSRDGCEAEAEKKGLCGNDYSNKLRRDKRAAARAERAA